jgi:hypothetical protein
MADKGFRARGIPGRPDAKREQEKRAQAFKKASINRKFFKQVLPEYEKELTSARLPAATRATDEEHVGRKRRRAEEAEGEEEEEHVDRSAAMNAHAGHRDASEGGKERIKSHGAKRPRPAQTADSESGGEEEEGDPHASQTRKSDAWEHKAGGDHRRSVQGKGAKKAAYTASLLAQPNRFTKALAAAAAKKQEEEKLRQDRFATKQVIAGKVAARADTKKKFQQCTRTGQPIMKHRLSHILSRLQRDIPAPEASGYRG